MMTKTLSARVVETKSDDAGGWVAIASTPTLDHDGEVLAAGCFQPLPASIKVHVDHDLKIASIVGTARPYYQGGKLYIEGRFAKTDLAQHVRQLVADSIVDSMSVVFIDAQRKSIDGIPTVTKGVLKACDFVTIGANPDARVVSVRSYQPGTVAEARRAAAEAKQTLADLDAAEAARIDNALADIEAVLRRVATKQVATPRPSSVLDLWRRQRGDH